MSKEGNYTARSLATSGITSSTNMEFQPTYKSIVEDGLAVLQHFGALFQHVTVMGTSLGGAVGTIALDQYVQEQNYSSEAVAKKFYLINHDSFSTTARVVMPRLKKVGDWISSLFGGLLDARKSMENLLHRKMHVYVFYHRLDPVIPREASMVYFLDQCDSLTLQETCDFVFDYGPSHACLDDYALIALKSIANFVRSQKQ